MTQEFVVTNGSVEYEHKRPVADYENKAPKVVLSFTVTEGSDPLAVTAKVMSMAVHVVNGALGLSTPPVAEPAPVSKSGKPGSTSKTKVIEPTPEPETPPANAAAIVEDEDEQRHAIGQEVQDDADLIGLAPVEKAAVTDQELNDLAQKVSAYLTQKDGNIKKLVALVKQCCGDVAQPTLQGIPPKARFVFVDQAKALLKA
jgi:hypothetical protein